MSRSRSTRPRSSRVALSILVLSLIAAACGTEGDDGGEPADDAPATDTADDAPEEPADEPEEPADEPEEPADDSAAESADDFPSKAIVFVAPGTVGGGSDVQARIAAQVMEEAEIFGSEPIAVLNRGGGGSQEAFTFMQQQRGDPHYMLTFQSSLLTYPLMGEAQYEMSDFTPIANVAMDPIIMVTHADSEYDSLESIIEASQAEPRSVLMAGGQPSGPQAMALALLEEEADFETEYLAFDGGGDTHAAILGQQVDAAVGNPSDFMASLEAGTLRGVAWFDDERSTVPILADTPTAAEQGYDVTFQAWRGWFAPADISPEQVAVLEEGLRQVTEDPIFTEEYTDRYGMRVEYMDSETFSAYLDEQSALYEDILVRTGIISG